ncbi:5937_t:CDS:10 [Diversispora eburnea]|uniref:5937_t:CDS:1 n=1 Tax=Diversispora eburnea TaxID=1213867 RepID=A0A9N8Z7P7_9GLOM|nr:5937_t:CDS:10 [Diversispora eburnea]
MNSKKSSGFNIYIILAFLLLSQVYISHAEIVTGVASIPTSNAWYYCSSSPVTSSSFYVKVVDNSTTVTMNAGNITEVLLPTNVNSPNGGVIIHFFNETGMMTYLDPTAATFFYYSAQSCKDPVMICSHSSSTLDSRTYCLSVSNSNQFPVKVEIYENFGGGGVLPSTYIVPSPTSTNSTTSKRPTIISTTPTNTSKIRPTSTTSSSSSRPTLKPSTTVIIPIGSSDASQLYFGEISKPTPKENELLVKVKSFGLNRMDILQREGKYPLPPDITDILGVEIAGIVEEIGRSVTNYKIGDRVFGLIYGGAYAEYACLNESMAMLLPDQLTFQQGAAIPEVWFTAYQALHLLAQIKEGQEILIHAGASGVGLAIVQLAKMAKAIFATVGSDVKIKYVEEIGATKCINYKTEDFKEKILEFTNGRGVDIIIDFVGKDYWHKNIDCLVIDGSNVDNVDLSVFLRKRIRVSALTKQSFIGIVVSAIL